MTKENFVDLIQHRLAGGDMTPDLKSKYHPEVIAHYISIAFNNVLFDLFRRNTETLDLYARPYELTIQTDSDRGMDYVQMTKPLIQLPNNAGIRMVSALKDPTYTLAPISQQAQTTFDGLEVGVICDKPTYFILNDKLYVQDVEVEFDELLVKMIIPFTELEDSDYVYPPSGKGPEILDLVTQFLMKMPPEDLRNDNNSERP